MGCIDRQVRACTLNIIPTFFHNPAVLTIWWPAKGKTKRDNKRRDTTTEYNKIRAKQIQRAMSLTMPMIVCFGSLTFWLLWVCFIIIYSNLYFAKNVWDKPEHNHVCVRFTVTVILTLSLSLSPYFALSWYHLHNKFCFLGYVLQVAALSKPNLPKNTVFLPSPISIPRNVLNKVTQCGMIQRAGDWMCRYKGERYGISHREALLRGQTRNSALYLANYYPK